MKSDSMYPDALASSEPATKRGAGVQPAHFLPRAAAFEKGPLASHASLARSVVAIAERLVCVAALLVLSPVWLTIAIAITVLSGESPLIAVLRAGRFARPLWLLKFRTMWSRSNQPRSPFRLIEYIVDEGGPLRKEPADGRITSRLARFCRRFSLDELPQLLNVIAGQMSLVAPRPLTISELSEHYGADAAEVLSVRPGITGLWQVSGRNSLTYEERRRLDVLLVGTLTLKLYLRILARTIPVVLTGRNSW